MTPTDRFSVPSAHAPRLEWLDALRGFTMILVVTYHVAQWCYDVNLSASAAQSFLVLVRMPLFFFVSGFLAYKTRGIETLTALAAAVAKKVKVQLVPTAVFLSAFLVIRFTGDFARHFHNAMQTPTKAGYWFTWALLVMFVAYYLFAYLERRLRWNKAAIVILWCAALALYETAYLPTHFAYPRTAFFRVSSLIEVIYFFHFFLFGNLVRRYWVRMERLMDAGWFFPAVILIAFAATADYFHWHTLRGPWANLSRTTAMYALMFVTVMTFRHYAPTFSHQHAAGRILQFVGRRTLDIYLLHFILMPRLDVVGQWLDAHQPNFLLELTTELPVALLIIGLCLTVSAVLRVSPFLRLHLFGRK